MNASIRPRSRQSQAGATLIEILVTLVILMIGLLGLVGMMIQSQRSQIESYQRVQALLVVQDMASRLNANKTAAPCYVLPTFVGTGNDTVPLAAACAVGTGAERARAEADLVEWRDQLLGSAERVGADNVGSVLGARGCITWDAAIQVYQVSVAWQGGSAIAAPPAGITCGQDEYGVDANRRAVSVTVHIGNLSS